MDLCKEIENALNALDAKYKNLLLERNANGRSSTIEFLKRNSFMKFNGKYFMKDKNGKWVFFKIIRKDSIDVKSTISNIMPNCELKDINGIIAWIEMVKDELTLDLEIDNNIAIFKNGYIDLKSETTELKPIDLELINKIPLETIDYNYDETLMNSETYTIMHKLINWCAKGNQEEYWTIMAMMGAILTNTQLEYFFNLYGVEGSGKSTLLDLIKQLQPSDRIITTPFQFLTKNNFGMIPLINKRLLVNSETSTTSIDPEVLKQLTTLNEVWSIEIKQSNEPYITKLPINIVLNSNQALRFKDYGGIDRRFVPIYFPYKQTHKGENFEALDYTNEFSKIKNVDGDYTFKREAVECLIPNMVACFKYFRKLWKAGDRWPIQSTYFKDITQVVKKLNNSPLQFIEDTDLLYEVITLQKEWNKTPKGIYYIDKKNLYKQYADYCLSIKSYQVKETQFFLEIEQILKDKGYECDKQKNVLQPIDGKSKRCFTLTIDENQTQEIKNQYESDTLKINDLKEVF